MPSPLDWHRLKYLLLAIRYTADQKMAVLRHRKSQFLYKDAQNRPINPFYIEKIENMNFFVFLKNDHFWDRLDGNGQKSPEKAPKTPGMTLIYLKTLKIIDFRTKIIG